MAWKPFTDWLIAHELALLEVSGEFPKRDINALFDRHIDQLAAQADQPDAARLDWVGYIAKSLRNSGFQSHDIDSLSHEIVVRLLVKPGNLFSGWTGQPILARFKTAVRNAVLNLREKRATRKRLIPSVGVEPGMALPATQSTSQDVIHEFRQFLRSRLGDAAVAVLDHRLSGGETRELIGTPGLETSYQVKQMVRAIKQAALEFAAGEPGFLAMVRQAMGKELETVQKRFAGEGCWEVKK